MFAIILNCSYFSYMSLITQIVVVEINLNYSISEVGNRVKLVIRLLEILNDDKKETLWVSLELN